MNPIRIKNKLYRINLKRSFNLNEINSESISYVILNSILPRDYLAKRMKNMRIEWIALVFTFFVHNDWGDSLLYNGHFITVYVCIYIWNLIWFINGNCHIYVYRCTTATLGYNAVCQCMDERKSLITNALVCVCVCAYNFEIGQIRCTWFCKQCTWWPQM